MLYKEYWHLADITRSSGNELLDDEILKKLIDNLGDCGDLQLAISLNFHQVPE